MSSNVLLLHMFPDYEPPEALQNAVSQAVIVAADVDPVSRSVTVAIHSPVDIPGKYLEKMSRDIEKAYGLKQMQILPTYAKRAISL